MVRIKKLVYRRADVFVLATVIFMLGLVVFLFSENDGVALSGAAVAAACGDYVCEAGESCALDCSRTEVMAETKGVSLSYTDPASGVTFTVETNNTGKKRLLGTPKHIEMVFETGSTPSATVTVRGLTSNAEYHLYADSYKNHVSFTSDAAGSYSFTQETDATHHVWIQDRPSTKFIVNNLTGGDCFSIGTWNSATKTCTLTHDLTESVEVAGDDATLDCGGHTISGSGSGNGVLLSGRTNATVQNCHISGFFFGIFLGSSQGNALLDNTVTASNTGIFLSVSNNNLLSGNMVNNNQFDGILLSLADSNTLQSNTINNNSQIAIDCRSSNNNLISNNIISNNKAENTGIVLFSFCDGNTISGNTVSQPVTGGTSISVSSGSDNNDVSNNNVSGGVVGISIGFGSDKTSTANNNLVTGNTARGSFHAYGVHGTGNVLKNNIGSDTVQDCIGLIARPSSTGNTIQDNTFFDCGRHGVLLQAIDEGANANIVTGNTVTNVGVKEAGGVSIAVAGGLTGSNGNTIYNNIFKSAINYFTLGKTSVNSWNISATLGKNIIGGATLGGNSWSHFDESSEGCNDANADGFCDSALVLDSSNTDNLPLTSGVDIDGDGKPETFGGDASCTQTDIQTRSFSCNSQLGGKILFSSGSYSVDFHTSIIISYDPTTGATFRAISGTATVITFPTTTGTPTLQSVAGVVQAGATVTITPGTFTLIPPGAPPGSTTGSVPVAPPGTAPPPPVILYSNPALGLPVPVPTNKSVVTILSPPPAAPPGVAPPPPTSITFTPNLQGAPPGSTGVTNTGAHPVLATSFPSPALGQAPTFSSVTATLQPAPSGSPPGTPGGSASVQPVPNTSFQPPATIVENIGTISVEVTLLDSALQPVATSPLDPGAKISSTRNPPTGGSAELTNLGSSPVTVNVKGSGVATMSGILAPVAPGAALASVVVSTPAPNPGVPGGCGDGICQIANGESTQTCPQDCPADVLLIPRSGSVAVSCLSSPSATADQCFAGRVEHVGIVDGRTVRSFTPVSLQIVNSRNVPTVVTNGLTSTVPFASVRLDGVQQTESFTFAALAPNGTRMDGDGVDNKVCGLQTLIKGQSNVLLRAAGGGCDTDTDGISDDVERRLSPTGSATDVVVATNTNLIFAANGDGSTSIIDPISLYEQTVEVAKTSSLGAVLVPIDTKAAGTITVNFTVINGNVAAQITGLRVPYPPGKELLLRSNTNANTVCIVDSSTGVSLTELLERTGCETNTAASKILLACDGVVRTFSGFPEAPLQRSYSCTLEIRDGKRFFTVKGLAFSAVTEFADADGDGLSDAADGCPTTPGAIDHQGCPVADKNTVQLHVLDLAKRGDCGGAGSCKKPLSDAAVKVFDRNKLANLQITMLNGSTTILTKNPDGQLYDDIYESSKAVTAQVGKCTTDASGVCVAGEQVVGDYLVLVKSVDGETGTIVYSGLPKSPGDFVDTNGDGLGDFATNEFQVIKVIRKDGVVEFKGGSKTVVKGSILEIVYPESTFWEGTKQFYPFIFTSDSSWTVDVCLTVQSGYKIVGVYDENGNLLSTSECRQAFVAQETKVMAFDVQEVSSPPPFMKAKLKVKSPKGEVHAFDLDIPGLRKEDLKAMGLPLPKVKQK